MEFSITNEAGETTTEKRTPTPQEAFDNACKFTGRSNGYGTCRVTVRQEPFLLFVQPEYKKDADGSLLEPIELLMIEVPEEYVGAVMERLGSRKAEIKNMGTREGGSTHLEFLIPSRGLLGYRSQFMTDTNGNGIMSHVFSSYEAYKGDIEQRNTGSIIVHEDGESTGYGLFNTQSRGRLFIGPGVPVYEGMIVGENPKPDDIEVNVCKEKHLTAIRSSGADEKLTLITPVQLSLEEAIEFITDEELIEVTPKSIRLRKVILDTPARKRLQAQKRAALKDNR